MTSNAIVLETSKNIQVDSNPQKHFQPPKRRECSPKGIKNFYNEVKEVSKEFITDAVLRNGETPELFVGFHKKENIIPNKPQKLSLIKSILKSNYIFYTLTGLGVGSLLVGMLMDFFDQPDRALYEMFFAGGFSLILGMASLLSFHNLIYDIICLKNTGYKPNIFDKIVNKKTDMLALSSQAIYLGKYGYKDGHKFLYDRYDMRDINYAHKVIDENGDTVIQLVGMNGEKLSEIKNYNEKDGLDLLSEIQSRVANAVKR